MTEHWRVRLPNTRIFLDRVNSVPSPPAAPRRLNRRPRFECERGTGYWPFRKLETSFQAAESILDCSFPTKGARILRLLGFARSGGETWEGLLRTCRRERLQSRRFQAASACPKRKASWSLSRLTRRIPSKPFRASLSSRPAVHQSPHPAVSFSVFTEKAGSACHSLVFRRRHPATVPQSSAPSVSTSNRTPSRSERFQSRSAMSRRRSCEYLTTWANDQASRKSPGSPTPEGSKKTTAP